MEVITKEEKQKYFEDVQFGQCFRCMCGSEQSKNIIYMRILSLKETNRVVDIASGKEYKFDNHPVEIVNIKAIEE